MDDFFEEKQESSGFFYKAYIGTADKAVPPELKPKITELAKWLDSKGYTLRSTGAIEPYPDLAFELGSTRLEIYDPWGKKLEKDGKRSKYPQAETERLAKKYNPVYDRMKEQVQTMMRRDVAKVLGDQLNSFVQFILCWTPDGAEAGRDISPRTGFTSIQIGLASDLKIPVFNLYKPDAETRLRQFVNNQPF